jgi:hypothetical protein
MLTTMRRILTVLLLGLATGVSAQVYRWVAPDGTVQYSDQPQPGATPVEVAPAQTMPAPPPTLRRAAPAPKPADSRPLYARFAVVSPGEQESVRANDGNVTISLAIEPPLLPGSRIVVLLDGQPVASPGADLTIPLTNLDRGTHRLEASVLDGGGNVLISAGPVTFHVLRVHLPPPRPQPPPPRPQPR